VHHQKIAIKKHRDGFLPYSAGKGHIDSEVDFLNLMPGRYHVSLVLGARGLLSDMLDYCGALEVEAPDFYYSGKGIDSRFGIIFLPFKCTLNGGFDL
jgi:hypothetical protein